MRIQKFSFLLILISIFIAFNLHAQKGYEDVVYLKNGSIIHGMIIEQVPDQSIKIQTRDLNVFFYKMEEIEKITKERPGHHMQPLNASELKSHPYSGFSMGLEAGIGTGIDHDNHNKSFISANGLFGYMHQSKLWAGISLGVNALGSDLLLENGFPFDYCLSLRVFPKIDRYSPLFIVDAGYATLSDNSYSSGGFLFNLGAGFRINETQKHAFNMAICFRAQQVHENKYNYSNYNYGNIASYNDHSFYYHAICCMLGFSF